MSDQYSIQLQTGCLQLSVLSTQYKLENLLAFGSRLNPKRRFLFVSKVLGKYIPCSPAVMRESYRALAHKIASRACANTEDVWVLGVAETATGLAAGVAQELTSKLATQQVIYSHTTRCDLASEIDFSILEEHSHAPSHLIYQLEESLSSKEVSHVVIVDDEISTGKTLEQITLKLMDRLPNLEKVTWVSLVNWVSSDKRSAFRQKYPAIELEFISLLDGTFTFVANDKFKDLLPAKTATGISSSPSREDLGRTGYLVDSSPRVDFLDAQGKFDKNCLDKEKAYLVLGTGEFSYQPFLLAEQMQQQGFDVLFQSTGRSPAIEDQGITSKLGCYDKGHQGMYYLYNLPEDREVILCYENHEQFTHCPFKEQLNAKTIILDTFQ